MKEKLKPDFPVHIEKSTDNHPDRPTGWVTFLLISFIFLNILKDKVEK